MSTLAGVRSVPAPASSHETPEVRRARAEWQAALLHPQGIDLSATLASWTPGEGRPRPARMSVVPSMGTSAAAAPKPIVIEGGGTPGLLAHVHAATRALPDGYAPRLLVIESDATAWLEMLSREDVSGVLGDERVWIGVGPGAIAALGQELRKRLDVSLPAQVVTLAANAASEGELRAVMGEQQALHARLREQAE